VVYPPAGLRPKKERWASRLHSSWGIALLYLFRFTCIKSFTTWYLSRLLFVLVKSTTTKKTKSEYNQSITHVVTRVWPGTDTTSLADQYPAAAMSSFLYNSLVLLVLLLQFQPGGPWPGQVEIDPSTSQHVQSQLDVLWQSTSPPARPRGVRRLRRCNTKTLHCTSAIHASYSKWVGKLPDSFYVFCNYDTARLHVAFLHEIPLQYLRRKCPTKT